MRQSAPSSVAVKRGRRAARPGGCHTFQPVARTASGYYFCILITLVSVNLFDTQDRRFGLSLLLCSLVYSSALHLHFSWFSNMFAADLSWTEPDTEKVGERRERIAKERSTPSAAPSVKSSRSSKASVSSIADDRELWWTSNLKKAKSLNPIRKPKLRPGTSRSTATQQSRKASSTLPRTVEIEIPNDLRDPSLQPAWTYSSSLSATLPSGAPLDPPEYEVPELEGDYSSRGTNSSGSRSSRKCRMSNAAQSVIDTDWSYRRATMEYKVARQNKGHRRSSRSPAAQSSLLCCSHNTAKF